MFPIFDILSPLIKPILDLIPTAEKRAEAQLKLQQELDKHSEELLKAFAQMDVAQTNVNVEEAKSTNFFIAGARPSIMWVCAAIFGWTYLLQPMTVFILTVSGHTIPNLPVLSMSEVMPVMLGMLGLGGMRTFEKMQGIQDKH